MTTAEPLIDEPTVPVADLEPMLGDRERECEIVNVSSDRRCGRSASWLLACDAADCGHWHGPVLACSVCKTAILSTLALVMCPHKPCPLACYVRWIEPL